MKSLEALEMSLKDKLENAKLKSSRVDRLI